MTEDKRTLKGIFENADAQRANLLRLWRDYAALTIADVLPPLNQDPNASLPVCWRSIGGEGTENMVGREMTSLFPVGVPWFQIAPSAELKASETLTTAQKNAFIVMLYQRELIAASKLEASNYRMAGRSALESMMIAGNFLVRWANDYSLRYFRPDNWVVRRGGDGSVLWTITREKKFAVELSEKDLARVQPPGSKPKDDDEPYELFTRCRRVGRGLEIQQEIDGKILLTVRPRRNPYICVAYRLCPGEDYARGFISTRWPDINSVNQLWEALIFGMANAAKMVPVIDPSEPGIRSADLLKDNGVPVKGRVVDGVIQGVGFLQTNKTADFGIAFQGAQALEKSLGRAMLLETAAMPTGERVTATAVMRIAKELEGAMGGPLTHIADGFQRPLVEHTLAQLEADKILVPMPAGADRAHMVTILTGPAALARQMELDKLLTAIQNIAALPGGLDRLDLNVVVDRLFSLMGVDTTGLFKTPQQVNAELQAQAAQVLQAEAAKTAVATIGALVEQRGAQAAP